MTTPGTLNLAHLTRRAGREHVIEAISFRKDWVRCRCGAEFQAEHDPVLFDRHEGLVFAWNEHRRSVGRAKVTG
jgi:hypothetical protein